MNTGGTLCALASRLTGWSRAIPRVIRLNRDDLASVACTLSASAAEYGYLSHHLDAVDVFRWLSLIWFVIAQRLGGRWWRTVNRPVSSLFQAKPVSLRLTGMALIIERAAFALFGAMVVSSVITRHWL